MDNSVLSIDDRKQVIKLLQDLDFFAGTATGILRAVAKKDKPVTLHIIKKMRESWYNNKSLIDLFIENTPSLTEKEVSIVCKWSQQIKGNFVCVAHESSGAILRPIEGNYLMSYYYKVLGITQEPAVMSKEEPPYFVKTTLLEYNNTLIWDGLLLFSEQKISPATKQKLQQEWQEQKVLKVKEYI